MIINLLPLLLAFSCILSVRSPQFFDYITIRIYRGDNPITLLQEETVNKEENVTEVSIEYENIPVLKAGTFYNLTKLQYIHIQRNNLEVLESLCFQNLPRIRTINLNFNRIKQIPENVFANLSVSKITLKGNGIDTLQENAFSNLTYLHTLDLSNNNIEKMPMDVFYQTRNLRILDLSYNYLNQYESILFRPYFNEAFFYNDGSEYSCINLSNNNFTYITKYMFWGLPCIGELKLMDNNIGQIDEQAFDSLRCLESLDMESNDLQEISDLLLGVFSMAKHLNMANNPWTNKFACKYETWCDDRGIVNTMDMNCSYTHPVER
ncbi:hypothetical protein JTB14_016801 [Gonioctena quinquepunctata]|nr:hypothetical protein JTB14_016801 [Gonioctena quinquepunctata]